MSDTRAARLFALFDRALDLSAADREEMLARECVDDPLLHAEVMALLAADASPTAALLDRPAIWRPLQPGEVIAGRYRIEREIGAGGMGIVFAAEQIEPKRRVAIKCLRGGLAEPSALQRFRREAAALGRLQHPGIAQVFEAGLTDGEAGVPFLAMEFVDGLPLLACTRELPLRQQLELLAAIAEAVGHAHERGVVHRDLKPANILVEHGSAGHRPRVLDFGVARFVDGDPELRTGTHQIIGTLGYLSPEQIDGGSGIADARSDVWALGVTAYEVLAGVLPLPLANCTLATAARLLRDVEPMPLERQQPACRGDVATIVHKALQKDPGRRYADANAFAADLRRHLAALPIAARPTSAFYRASRLVQRHRGLFLGLALAFVALVAGLVAALTSAANAAAERDRAQRAIGELRGLLRTLVRDVDGELLDFSGALAARQLLLTATLAHADLLVADDADSEPLLEVASLFERLAGLQGRPGGNNLGNLEAALVSQQSGLALIERALVLAPGDPRLLSGQLRLLRGKDSLLRALGHKEQRKNNLEAALAVAEQIRALYPGPGADDAAADAAADLGRLQADLGQLDAALASYQRMRLHLEQQAKVSSGSEASEALGSLRIMLMHIGNLHERRGDVNAARATLAESVAVAEALLQQDPGPLAQRDLARSLRNQATFFAMQGEYEAALTVLERIVAEWFPVAATEPDDFDSQRLVCIVEFGRAHALLKLDRRSEGLATLTQYLQRIEHLLATTPQPGLRRDLVIGQQLRAKELAHDGDFVAARAAAAAALDTVRQLAAANPDEALAVDDELNALGIVAFVAELRVARLTEDDAERGDARAAAAAALTALLDFAAQAAARQLLAARRQSLLTELPPRIAALRVQPR